MKSGELIRLIKATKGLDMVIFDDYRLMPLCSPNDWKDGVNAILSKHLKINANFTANILNAVISRL